MKKPAMGLVVLLMMVGVGFAAQKDSTFSGEITDRYCAKANSHEEMMKRHSVQTTKECIPACVKAGGAFVLFDAATKTIYELDDQQKPARFAEQKVKVTGTYDKAKQTIHVTDIQPSK
jgi:type 1 fimbria pilin